MLCFRILIRKGEITTSNINSLIKREVCLDKINQPVPLKFFLEYVWSGITGLDKKSAFGMLLQTMEQEYLQWKKQYGEEKAELIDLPKSFKDISMFYKLLVLRAMRPNRLINALKEFVNHYLGTSSQSKILSILKLFTRK